MVFLLICSLSTSQALREQIVSLLVMMWYDTYSFIPLHFLLSLFLWNCIYIYIYISFLLSCQLFLPSSLALQVEVPPPVTSGALVKEVVTTQSPATLGVEKEPPSGGMAKEARQAVKDAKSIPSFTSLAI